MAPKRTVPFLAPDQVDRVADVLLALETAPAVGFRLAALGVIDRERVEPAVQMQLGDHRFRLSPAEVRMVARCIGFEDQRRATGMLVSLFESAACDAEGIAATLARKHGLTVETGVAA